MSDVVVRPRVAIVDYGMGNLFSVKHACEHVGLDATITETREPMLKGLPDGTLMYFVHSLYVAPERPDLAVTMTRYGAVDFCSSLRSGAVFACQFHPERSGPAGLSIYANLAAALGVPTQER